MNKTNNLVSSIIIAKKYFIVNVNAIKKHI